MDKEQHELNALFAAIKLRETTVASNQDIEKVNEATRLIHTQRIAAKILEGIV